jgi:hypothetical protein
MSCYATRRCANAELGIALGANETATEIAAVQQGEGLTVSPPPDKVKPILTNGWNSPDVAAEEGVTEGEDVKPEGAGEGSKSKSQLSNEKGEDMVETREQP